MSQKEGMNMNFIEKLDMLMAEKGINRSDLSRGCGVPYMTIVSFYEKGYKNAKLSTLRKIALFFDCGLDYLVDEKITDRNYKPFNVNDLTPSEIKMMETYYGAKKSDKATVKALVVAIDRMLGINEQDNE